MKIIISPAKKMKMIDDINIECTTPMFLSKTTELLNHIKSLDYSELKSYLKCSDTIAQTTYDQIKYIQGHLYILSGFYGLLKPLDAITPYRLEMQTKCPFSLYDFWKDDLAKQIDEPILNLASEEYAKIIRKYKPLIDVRFVEENGKEKGVYAKMARGAMVRYLAENKIENIKDITQFSDLGYTFDASQSTEKLYIFQKKLSS